MVIGGTDAEILDIKARLHRIEDAIIHLAMAVNTEQVEVDGEKWDTEKMVRDILYPIRFPKLPPEKEGE